MQSQPAGPLWVPVNQHTSTGVMLSGQVGRRWGEMRRVKVRGKAQNTGMEQGCSGPGAHTHKLSGDP